jgi:hypothetical protein
MSSFTKIGTSVLAGLMLVAVAGSAGAHESASSRSQSTGQIQSTQAKADAARARAAELARQGGWAYKTGAVDRANADAARYQAEADAARAALVPAEQPLVSAELAAAQERLADLRQAGGWAYKSGAVARAEADVRALSGPAPVTMGLNEAASPASSNWGKPVEKTLSAYR